MGIFSKDFTAQAVLTFTILNKLDVADLRHSKTYQRTAKITVEGFHSTNKAGAYVQTGTLWWEYTKKVVPN